MMQSYKMMPSYKVMQFYLSHKKIVGELAKS